MRIINELNEAINFIEENIFEPITYEDVAKHLHMSNYHFHRIFSLITGITPTNYIRKRRLSLAGQEVETSDVKIIDIAYKYNYETPESFIRAFTRFHGITPNEVKKSSQTLSMFNPLTIKLSIEGGKILNYRLEEKPPFTLLTISKDFKNEIISDDNNTEISDFWDECRNNKVFNILDKYSNNTDIYGICAPISKESKTFKYGIGVEYSTGNIPNNYYLWEIDNPLWAVFSCIGDDGSCIEEMWTRIFSEFLPSSNYELIDSSDFELYSDRLEEGCFCEIWIPVKRNNKN